MEEKVFFDIHNEQDLIELAKHRIKVKRDLISHITSFVFVNGFLYLLFRVFLDIEEWIYYIILASWGLGLAFHIVNSIQELSFNYNGVAIQKEMEKIKKHLNKIDK